MFQNLLLAASAFVVPLLPLLAHCRHGGRTHLEVAGHCHAHEGDGNHKPRGAGTPSERAAIEAPHVSHEAAPSADLHTAHSKPGPALAKLRAPLPGDASDSLFPASRRDMTVREDRGPPPGPRLHLLLASHLL